jgi:heme-degrading monooxygenase HmoA
VRRKENCSKRGGFLAVPPRLRIGLAMVSTRSGQIAVIFASQRTTADSAGYREASAAMEALAAVQPGYVGMISARGDDGYGITVSFWDDEESARAWRHHPEHSIIRDRGRSVWYDHFQLDVAHISRCYDWKKHG